MAVVGCVDIVELEIVGRCEYLYLGEGRWAEVVSNVGYCERLLDFLDADWFDLGKKRYVKRSNSTDALAFY